MVVKKKIYGATDAKEVVLYLADDKDSELSSPVTAAMLNPGLAIPEYDQIDLTYISAGSNGAGEISTVIYKLSAVSVATITITYNSSDTIASVVKT